ncbi:MAG: hypothetical protein ACU0CI_08875, partial [Shimia sp.]
WTITARSIEALAIGPRRLGVRVGVARNGTAIPVSNVAGRRRGRGVSAMGGIRRCVSVRAIAFGRGACETVKVGATETAGTTVRAASSRYGVGNRAAPKVWSGSCGANVASCMADSAIPPPAETQIKRKGTKKYLNIRTP